MKDTESENTAVEAAAKVDDATFFYLIIAAVKVSFKIKKTIKVDFDNQIISFVDSTGIESFEEIELMGQP